MALDETLTTTTHANYIPEIWAQEALEAVEFSAVFQKRVNRKYEAVARVGDTVHIPYRSNLNTQSKAYSGGLADTINWQNVTENMQNITIQTVEYAAFLLEDVVAAQANQDIRQGYTRKIGYALTRGREVSLAALVDDLASGNDVGTLNVELTSDDYLTAYQNLLTAGLLEDNVDPGADFSVILSPQAWVAALKVDVFTNRQYNTAGDAIQRASIGNIYGTSTFVSNLTNSNSSGHDCVMMHRDAMALVVQKEVPVKSAYIIESLGDGVVGWNLYGVSTLAFPPETMGGGAATANRGSYLKTV